ncbi:MAG: alkaline phosphatase family protein [Nitrospinae bacterium]|nr:alkaline phosphatase family protein [Nitrospinota bacterium]
MSVENKEGRGRVYVVGLDGATFDIINPMVARGLLPNLAAIMKEGVHAPLRSTVPAFSPVAWTSIMTGVNPGRHGIADAFIHHPDYRMSFANSTYRKCRPVWAILNEMGYTTGVMNVPLTYPPEHVDGFMITGMFTPETATDFTWPVELMGELRHRFGKYRFEAVQSENLDKVISTTYESIDQKDRVLEHLLEKSDPDFVFMVFVETDRIQHQFWKFIDPLRPDVDDAGRAKYGSVISDVYARLDRSLGKIMARLTPKDSVVIVSDHGFGPLRRAFSLGNWLIDNGYTAYSGNSEQTKPSFASSLIDVFKRKALGVGPDKDKQINRFFNGVDWACTKAFTEGAAGGIFINSKDAYPNGLVNPGDEYENLREEIIDGLMKLQDPATGKLVVEAVHRREDVYKPMPSTQGIPDLIVTCAEGYHTISPSEAAYYKLDIEGMFFTHRWSGRHADYGVFMMKGPSARQGVKLERAHVNDVTPTVIHLMGSPVSGEFDGRPLYEGLTGPEIGTDAAYSLANAGVVRDFSSDEARQIEEKLKELGYLD